jgi:hypothetical protein
MQTQIKKTYKKPVVTRVAFTDKALISFSICRKATQGDQLSESCCSIDTQPGFTPDPS